MTTRHEHPELIFSSKISVDFSEPLDPVLCGTADDRHPTIVELDVRELSTANIHVICRRPRSSAWHWVNQDR